MAKYIMLVDWTDQGIRNVKDSPKRVDAGRELAKQCGCMMGDFYMTIGNHDMVTIVDAPDDAAIAKFALRLAGGGNVRTTTLKAFGEEEYRKILGGL